jgi:hypothetical protein
MANPVRFPAGLSTFAPRSTLGTYPISTSPRQIAITEDFIPYRPGDYTVTTAVAGTAATFAWEAGAIKLSTSASATDTIYLMRNGAAFQSLLGNQLWYDIKLAYPRTVQNANDTNIYAGLFDNAVPSSASNGIYFFKPSGGTAVHFVIKKVGVTTTFQNIADLALPSGLFGDTNSVNGLLNATVAGTAFTAVSINTPGAGYQTMPLVLSTITSGVAGNVPVTVQLGSTALSATNPQVPVISTALPYGSLAIPYITNPGAGYTNAGPVTTYLEAEPLIDLQFWFDPKGILFVGVNGRTVMKIEGTATGQGVVGFAAGATINVATQTAPSFATTTQLTTSVAPFQPPIGNAFNILPLIPLNAAFGFANTTANIRTLYAMEYNLAVELN